MKIICGVDPGVKNAGGVAVYVLDQQSGKHTLMSMHESRLEALKAMQRAHAYADIPYQFYVDKKGNLKVIGEVWEKPKTVLEILRRGQRG